METYRIYAKDLEEDEVDYELTIRISTKKVHWKLVIGPYDWPYVNQKMETLY